MADEVFPLLSGGCQGGFSAAQLSSAYAGRAVASLPAIAAGTSLAVTFQLQLDCPSWGDAHALDAKISSVAIDPDRDNNVPQTLTTFGADLSVSSTMRPWVRSYPGEQPMDLTEDGEIILGCGNTIFESPTFDTRELGSVGTELLVDLLVPSGTPSGWVGDLQLHVDVPGRRISGTNRQAIRH